MITACIILLSLIYITLELYDSPVRTDHFTRLTILRCKLQQEELKHHRNLNDHKEVL